MGGALAGGYSLILLFLVVLAVLWLILPFALFGTKPLLRDLLAEQRRTNALLEELRAGTVIKPTEARPADTLGTSRPRIESSAASSTNQKMAVIVAIVIAVVIALWALSAQLG